MSKFFVTVPLPGETFDETEEARDKMIEDRQTEQLNRQIEERPPLGRTSISWQAAALIAGMPYSSEAELFSSFGNGRSSRAAGQAILSCEKEVFPTKFYVV